MATNVIGSAFVKIAPDTSGFGALLQSGTAGPIAALTKAFGAPGVIVGALATAVLGIGTASVVAAVKFQQSLANIQANMGITANAATAIGNAFLSTAFQVTFTAQTIAEAFAPVSATLDALNGHVLTAAQSLAFMNQAMVAAEATGAPLAETTAALAAVMVAYHLPLVDAANATNILTVASIDLNTPITDLANVIDKMRGKLGDATPSLAEIAALMVELTRNGVPARLAVSDVSGAITSLIDPSTKGAVALKDLGLKVIDAKGNFIGIDSIIAQLNPKFAKMTQQQQLQTAALIFGKAPAAAMMAIIDAGPAAYDKLAAALQKTNAAETIASTKTNTLGEDWKKFTSGVGDAFTALGNKILPVINDITSWVTKNWVLIENTTSAVWNATSQNIVLIWNIITTTIHVALVAIIAIVTALWNGVAAATKLAWNVISGIVAVGVAVVTGIIDSVSAVIGFLAGVWSTVTTGVKNFISGIVGFFAALPGNIIRALGNLGSLLWNAGASIINGFLNGLKSAWNAVTGWITGIGTWISQHKGPLSADLVLLYPHGQAIMQGLHNGLKAGIPPILSTLTGLSTSMKGAVGGGGSLSLTGASSAGAVTIVQNFPHSASASDVQAVVARENAKLVTALRAGRR